MKILQGVTAMAAVGIMMLAVTGCKRGTTYVDKLADLSKKACACADKNCAEVEFNNFIAIVDDMKKTNAKVTNEEGKKLGEHTAIIMRCLITKGVSPVTVQQELQKLK